MRQIIHMLAGAGACLLLAAVPATSSAQGSQTSACYPADHGQSRMILSKAGGTISSPRAVRVRNAMGLPEMPADSAVLVTDAEKCGQARALIDASRGESISSQRLVLVRIGNRYWAEDPTLRGGEFTDVYLLDAGLTRVLARH